MSRRPCRLPRGLGALLLLLAPLAACSKSGQDAAPDAGVSPTTTTQTADGGAAAASGDGGNGGASGTTAAGAKAGAKSSWSLTYSVSPGKLYIPDSKDWSSTKQAKSDDSKHVGEGKLALEVDETGRVSGTTEDGPLGASIVAGRLEEGALHATIRRKDPSDDGLTGTLIATVTGDKLEGTMELADGTAASVREAKVSGTKGK